MKLMLLVGNNLSLQHYFLFILRISAILVRWSHGRSNLLLVFHLSKHDESPVFLPFTQCPPSSYTQDEYNQIDIRTFWGLILLTSPLIQWGCLCKFWILCTTGAFLFPKSRLIGSVSYLLRRFPVFPSVGHIFAQGILQAYLDTQQHFPV